MKKYFIFLLYISQVWAQDPFYLRIDKEFGLPSNNIYDILQDKKGFMWFATSKGICKYNGSDFTIYSNKNITNKAGSNLVEDSQNRMWYINFDGYISHVQGEKLISIPQESTVGYLPFGILANNLIYVQKNKIVVQNTTNYKVVKSFPYDVSTLVNTLATSNNVYVLGASLMVISSDLETKTYALPDTFKQLKGAYIIKNIGEKLYFFNKVGGIYFTFENGVFQKNQLSDKNFLIQNVSIIDNEIWLCSTTGLAKLKINQLEKFYHNINISYLYKDTANNYWIATLNEGLLLVSDFQKKIIPTPEIPISLYQKNGDLYFGSISNGLWQYDSSKNKQKIIAKNNNNHEIYLAKNFGDYTFTSASGFSIYNKQHNLICFELIAVKDVIKIDHKYFAMAASGFNAIFCLNKNLISEWDNLYASKNNNLSTKTLKKSILQAGIKGKSVAYNSFNKTIYFSTNEGVFCQTKNKFFKLKYHKKDFYLNKIVSYKNVIIGNATNGQIFEINASNQIEKINITGLNSTTLNNFKLLNNSLYFYTDKTIFSYNLETKKVEPILNSNQNFDVSDIEISNNKIVFATKKGLIITENKLPVEKALPQFLLDKVTINANNSYSKMPPILKFDENTIAFHFSVLNFVADYKYPIQYNINGKKWYTLDENNKTVTLNELSSGEYLINFRIYNAQKTEFREVKTEFEINKPFWKTFKFLFILLTLSSIISYFFYYLQIKKIMKANAQKLEKSTLETNYNKSKLKAIKSQMNPHFFYNALNTIQSYILSNDKKLALDYLSKFSNLTRTILEFSEKDFVSIAEEIETLQLYLELEKARFEEKEMDFKIKIENIIETDKIKIPSMLLQPYVENALKHGLLHKKGYKLLEIVFNKTENLLNITINDNGIGRQNSEAINKSRANNRTSFATEAMESRINILNQNNALKIELKIIDKINEHNQSLGTTVIFKIPIN